MGAGRKKEAMLDDVTIDKLVQLIDSVGGQRNLGKLLEVSNSAIAMWVTKRSKPSSANAYKIEEITNGNITAEELINTQHIDTKDKTLYDVIVDNFINESAHIVGLTPEEYYRNFTPFIIKKIVDANYITDVDIPYLFAFYRKSEAWWRQLKRNFNERDKRFVK